jgi:hypothetical protein
MKDDLKQQDIVCRAQSSHHQAEGEGKTTGKKRKVDGRQRLGQNKPRGKREGESKGANAEKKGKWPSH